MAPRISVVVPLTHERGPIRDTLLAWIGQFSEADRLELVVVAGDGANCSGDLHGVLRPHDRVVSGRFANIAAMYDAGVRAGGGEWIFLTESHCHPAPDCLESTERYLTDNPHLVGAATHSVAACQNAYAQIDAETFYEGFWEFVRPGDWRKLNVHGFALKRSVYLDLGGFQHQYGRYAEMLLAARIRDAGLELGYAREAVITHHYRGTLGELLRGIDEYIGGESIYRSEHPGRDRVGYTYLPEVSHPRSARAGSLEREVAATLLRGVFGPHTEVTRLGLRVACHAAARVLGWRGAVGAAWLGVLAARVRCWWNRHDRARLDGPYRDLIRRASILSRVRALASLPLDEQEVAPSGEWGIEDLPDCATYGFHGTEWWEGRAFRWSAPVAGVRLPLGREDTILRLVTGGLRSEYYPAHLRVSLNGVRLDVHPLPSGDYEFPIASAPRRPGVQTLVWMCHPLCPWEEGIRDHRQLGLPVFRLESGHAAGVSSRAVA